MILRSISLPLLCASILVAMGPLVAAPKPATLRIGCNSIRVPPATVKQLGLESRLSFTISPDGINDELQSSSDGPGLYASTLQLETPTAIEPIVAPLSLGIPDTGDRNLNGVNDFFEVALEVVPVSTEGTFETAGGPDAIKGSLSATWQRTTNTARGTVKMRLRVPSYGVDLTFNHEFEIFEYLGTLTYDASGTNIASQVELNRQGAEGRFAGPFPMTALNTDELLHGSAVWTNAAGTEFQLIGSLELDPVDPLPITRGGAVTNYFGVFYFADGDPSTPFADEYDLWTLDLWDPNDGDGDRLPDLTDHFVIAPPAAPKLGIRAESGGLKLKVEGDTGTKVLVQQREAIDRGDWVTIRTVTIGVDPIEVDLEVPPSGRAFWRGSVGGL